MNDLHPALVDTLKMIGGIQHETERVVAFARLDAWHGRLMAGKPILFQVHPRPEIELGSRSRQERLEVAIGVRVSGGMAAIRWHKDGRELRFTHPYWPCPAPPVGDPDWQHLCELAESIDPAARAYVTSDNPGERSKGMAWIEDAILAANRERIGRCDPA